MELLRLFKIASLHVTAIHEHQRSKVLQNKILYYKHHTFFTIVQKKIKRSPVPKKPNVAQTWHTTTFTITTSHVHSFKRKANNHEHEMLLVGWRKENRKTQDLQLETNTFWHVWMVKIRSGCRCGITNIRSSHALLWTAVWGISQVQRTQWTQT